MTSRKSKISKFFWLLVIGFASSTAVASPFQNGKTDVFWSDERSHLGQLKSLFTFEPNLKNNAAIETSSSSEAICMDPLQLRAKDSSDCPRVYFQKSVSSGVDRLHGQIKSYLRIFHTTEAKNDWRNYFYLASAFVRLGDYETSSEIIDLGIERFVVQLQGNVALEKKFSVFRRLLVELKNTKIHASQSTKSPTGVRFEELATRAHFSDKALSLIRELPLKNNSRLVPEDATLSHADALRAFTYEKWRIEQELDEIQALRTRLTEPRTYFDAIARTDLLAERLSISSPEWTAIVNMAAKLKSKAELVSKSSGLKDFLDAWVADEVVKRFRNQSENDNFVVRARLITQNLIPLFLKISKKLQSKGRLLNSDARLQAIVDRLTAMQGSMHSFIESVAFDSELGLAKKVLNSFLNVRRSMLEIQARLAALDDQVIDDPEKLQQLRVLDLEHKELKDSYHDLLQKITVHLHAHDPLVRASLRQTSRRVSQLDATLTEIELITRSSPFGAAPFIFNDLRELLNEISLSLNRFKLLKKNESLAFSAKYLPIKEESQVLFSDVDKFFTESGEEINSTVKNMLRKIETVLISDREIFELAIAQRKSMIQSDLEGAAKSIEAEINKAESVRRIYQQNFEWRLAR